MSFAQPSGNQYSNGGGYGDNGGSSNNNIAEWDSLHRRCLQQLTTLSSEKTQTEHMMSKIGSPEDSLEFRARIRGKLNYIQDSCSKCANDIKHLKKMNAEEKDAGTRSKQKVICSKLEKDFAVIQQSANALSREWAIKEKKNIPIPAKQNTMPSQNRFHEESNERQSLLADTKQLHLVEQQLDTQDDIIAEREQGIDNIHSKMVDVNEIFHDLNHIVVEQAPLVDHIQSSIEHARFDVEKGVVELEKATVYQKKAGSKTKYIVCILILIMIVLTAIVVLAILLGLK